MIGQTREFNYSKEFIYNVVSKFGEFSSEYNAALKGFYEIGDMIEAYCAEDNITDTEFIEAYERGEETLCALYQRFKLAEPYRQLHNQWLNEMYSAEEDEVELDFELESED